MGDEQSAHSDAVQTNTIHNDTVHHDTVHHDTIRHDTVHHGDLSSDMPPDSLSGSLDEAGSLRPSENGRPGKTHAPKAHTSEPHTVDAVRADAIRSGDYSFIEVANLLNVSPDTLRRLSLRFADYLGEGANEDEPTYTRADVTTLSSVQKLLAQGYDDEQIGDFLTIPSSPAGDAEPSLHSIIAYPAERRSREASEAGSTVPKTVNDILATISGSQQAVLNSQSTVREVVGVLVQDNFNLKDENRKLRERMLEVERSLAEYQRREEARKERLDGRLRALEGTMAALQQQVAQLVQLQRQQRKRRGWFG